MSYGLRIHDAGGGVTFDSSQAAGGQIVALVNNAGTGSTHTFPDFPGLSAFVVDVASLEGGVAVSGYTVDYALGYPRVILPAGCQVAVFVS